MSPDLLKAASAYFREHEGVIPHMYLCIHGHVTAGVGHLFPSAVSARAAGWTSGGRLAAWGDIDAGWGKVKSMPYGQAFPASGYENATTLRLGDAAIDGLLRSDLEAFESRLAREFADWDHFPLSAQLGLLDMIFSIGPAMFGTIPPKAYPRLVAAAKRQDWTTCARECDRKGVATRRNLALRELFQSAR